jgi:hypothetical protein
VETLDLNNIDIEAIDAIDVPVGTYTVPYTIGNLNEYAAQYGVTVSVSVVDANQNDVSITENSFAVEEGAVYTVTITIKRGEEIVKSKTVTITAVSSNLPKLATPQNLARYGADYISFNSVENAIAYTLSVNGTDYQISSTMPSIASYISTPAEYTVKVKAVASGYADSDYSAELIVSTLIQQLNLASSPKTAYVEGEYFDYDNIVIEATYTDGTKSFISTTTCLISIVPGTELGTSDTEVLISHSSSGKEVSIPITVIALGDARWTVTFVSDGGTRVGGGAEVQNNIPHNGSATAPQYTRKGYYFLGFDKEFSSVTESITVTAQWQNLSVATSGLDFTESYDYQTYSVSGYWGSSENVVIPSTYNGKPVTAVLNNAFINNKNIRKVFLPSSAYSVFLPFLGCTNLTGIYVDEYSEFFSSIDGILYNKTQDALILCPEGKSGQITIAEGTETIAYRAFANCSIITGFVVPDSVCDIGDGAFYGTAWLANQADGMVYAGKVIYTYKGTMPQDSVLEIAEDTTGIAASAFYDQSNLKE